MQYDEVRSMLLGPRGRARFETIFPSVTQGYESLQRMLVGIERAVKKKEEKVEAPKRVYEEIATLLRHAENQVMFAALDKMDVIYVSAIVELVNNWAKLDHGQDVNKILGGGLRRLRFLVKTKKTMDESVEVLSLLLKRARTILENEPFTAKVSDMYARYLDDYLAYRKTVDPTGPYDTDSKEFEKVMEENDDKDRCQSEEGNK